MNSSMIEKKLFSEPVLICSITLEQKDKPNRPDLINISYDFNSNFICSEHGIGECFHICAMRRMLGPDRLKDLLTRAIFREIGIINNGGTEKMNGGEIECWRESHDAIDYLKIYPDTKLEDLGNKGITIQIDSIYGQLDIIKRSVS